MSENAYKQLVTGIEALKDEKNHEYILVTTQLKDGATKQKKVYDRSLKKKFTTPGWYELRYDDATHYLTGVEFIGTGKEGSVPPIIIGSTYAPMPSKSLKNDLQGQLDAKSREIRGAVILKATSEYLAASVRCQEITETAFEEKAQHAFKVFQNLLEAYVADKKPDFETVSL